MLHNQNTNPFISYLDSVKKDASIDYQSFIVNVNNNYIINQYYAPSFSGIHIPKYSNKSALSIVKESYKPNTPIEPFPIVSVNIDTNIQTINDLITIVEKNPYDTTKQYNIDLKALHSIKTELAELNAMVGMESLKICVLGQLLYFVQGLHLGNEVNGGDFKHTVISGPPGTGKTEVAKIIGKMYSKLGILKSNVFKKVTRNDLVAGYLGQTALKTKQVIDDCSGGVLFIDEAYSLANSDDLDSYSRECVDTLCEALSDKKDNLMVIIAGYEDQLNTYFFPANQGLESRFIWRFKIDNYTASELRSIFLKKVKLAGWSINDTIIDVKWFEKHKSKFKHYGRDMEQLFLYTKICHSKRIYGKPDIEKKHIVLEDINAGFTMFINNCKKENELRKQIIESLYV
jgi:AAA+ superfamily predicted ATPase